jgi:hypothetical protein
MAYGIVSLVLNGLAVTLYSLLSFSDQHSAAFFALHQPALLLVIAAFVTGLAGMIRDNKKLTSRHRHRIGSRDIAEFGRAGAYRSQGGLGGHVAQGPSPRGAGAADGLGHAGE